MALIFSKLCLRKSVLIFENDQDIEKFSLELHDQVIFILMMIMMMMMMIMIMMLMIFPRSRSTAWNDSFRSAVDRTQIFYSKETANGISYSC